MKSEAALVVGGLFLVVTSQSRAVGAVSPLSSLPYDWGLS